MNATLTCACGETLFVGDRHQGVTAKCFACGNVVTEAGTSVAMDEPTPSNPDGMSDTREPVPRSRAKVKTLVCIALAGLFLIGIGTLSAMAVFRIERSANQLASGNNLSKLGEALHAYTAAHERRLPGQAIINKQTGQPLLSWRVALLPFLAEEALYQQIHLDEPWDSSHNRQFWDKMPKVYQLPGKPNDGMTYYQVFHGEGALFGKPHQTAAGDFLSGVKYKIGNIPDGTSQTIFAVEAAEPVNWMKPEDIPFYRGKDGTSATVLGTHWGDGTSIVLLFDARIYRLTQKVEPDQLQSMVAPDDMNPMTGRKCN